jgi:hypothetical protein
MTATLVRACWGTALLAFPGQVLRAVGHAPTPAARLVLRVLGARQVAQALVIWRSHEVTAAREIGAAVDVAHATSCLVIACTIPSWRRAAAIDMVLAAALATAALR